MYSVYTEELERKRVVRAVQGMLLKGMVFSVTLTVCGVIGWMGLGGTVDVVSLVMIDPPTMTH